MSSRVRWAAFALVLAACGGTGGEPGPAKVEAGADSAAAAGQGTADSVAQWRARFGNRVPRPDSIRALYVNGWAAGGRTRMRELIRIADETEINAFVVDIKESDTYLTHDSTGIALAREIGADTMPRSKWLPELVDTLIAHGIYPIARIVVFKDRMLAERKPELAIRHTDGSVWLDQKGKPWVNPYDRRVWDYNVAIAKEALDMGFSEVQWDYVRFPDVTEARRRTMAFPGAGGVSREDNIAAFIRYSKEQLAEYQVPVTADVFGLATHVEGDVGIGQNWEKVISTADAVLPMVYPSHYFGGVYGFSRPNAHPYEMVRISMQDAVERTRAVQRRGQKTGEIIPWLQAFTADYLHDGITYGASHVRQQIAATYDSGLKSWVLWNPGSKYDVYLPALRPADGSPSPLERGGWKPLAWQVPRARMSAVVRRMDQATRAAAADSARGASGDSTGGARREGT
ncbi:putative glycoside hydrolase [Longimicrobium sp.]|uniref:putative glycoside hydrolase n=1 Tax=Longimicrobium sp. TaxID=2029185 RepID=UPI003B3A2FB9